MPSHHHLFPQQPITVHSLSRKLPLHASMIDFAVYILIDISGRSVVEIIAISLKIFFL